MIEKFIHFKDFEKQNLILKMLFNNRIINKNKYKRLHRRNKLSSISLIRNICIYTNRSKGIIKNYKISRLEFKRLNLAGVRKSSF